MSKKLTKEEFKKAAASFSKKCTYDKSYYPEITPPESDRKQ